MGIKHAFVSGVSDSSDATRVRPSNWNAEHTIDSDVDFNGFSPTNMAAEFREILTATRTYYVRKDGSDSNTGLVDSAGGAFLTIAKAMDEVGKLDIGNGDYASFLVDVVIGNGTYAETIDLPRFTGSGLFSDNITGASSVGRIKSSSGVSANVIVSGGAPAGICVRATNNWGWLLENFTVRGDGGNGNIIQVTEESILRISGLIIDGGGSLGADRATTGIQVYDHSEVYVIGNTNTWKGKFITGIDVAFHSIFYSFGRDMLLSGTVDCSGEMVFVSHGSEYYGNTLDSAAGTLAGSEAFGFGAGGGTIYVGVTLNDFGNTDRWGNATAGSLLNGGTYNSIRLPADVFTFATLPNVAQHGMLIPISDSTTTTWGATITGGGANKVLGFYNGTNWTVAAI